MNKTISTATSLIFAASLATAASSGRLKLIVDTTTQAGNIRAAVYSSAEAFEKKKQTAVASQAVSGGKTELNFNNLTLGTYGVALFHDVNGNTKLDRNLLGAPKEPFGFSTNPVIKFSAPKFEAFKFEFDGSDMVLNITLNGA